MVGSGGERRMTGSVAGGGLPPCCESWVAEQLLEEAKRGRRGPARPGAGAAPACGERERSGPADARPDIRLA